MCGVLERCRSSTPELRKRKRGSSDVVTDTETSKMSPTAYLTNNAVEHSTSQLTSPRTSAMSIPTAHGIISEVESLHDECDNINKHAVEPIRCSDTTNSKISVTDADAETLQSGRKKKKRRSPVSNVDSKDVGHTAVKEDRKHKHKNRSHETSEKDETHKAGHAALKTTNKDSVDDVSHFDNKAKLKDSVDDVSHADRKAKHKDSADDTLHADRKAKHKDSADDTLHADRKAKHKDSADDMSHADRKAKHKDSTDDTSHSDHKAKHKDIVDDMSHAGHKAKHKDIVDDASHSDDKAKHKDSVTDMSHADRKAKHKKTTDETKHKRIVEDVVNNESTSNKMNKRSKSDEISASKSLDNGTAKTTDISRKVVRQYRHQDGIRERTCNRTPASRKKREKPVSVSSHVCRLLTTLTLTDCICMAQLL